jgi:Tannase and feruloyl esterase
MKRVALSLVFCVVSASAAFAQAKFPVEGVWKVAEVIVPGGNPAATCEGLAALALPHTKITSAQNVAAGAFAPASLVALRGMPPASELPAFCRVAAKIKPTLDSDIGIEVWMPASGWNGKFVSVGNGGWAGQIPYQLMALALTRGYAAAGTDTGHEGDMVDAGFAVGHPERMIDFGYRAVHEMTVKAKAVIEAFYGKGPRHSYWDGCSTGGKQGLTEAQRFPYDYDGIIAGAPANFFTHLVASGIWNAQALSNIPREKHAMIHKAVLEACDSLDGVQDGLLEDPTRCHFDPKLLLCKQADGPDCLTPAQVEAVSKIYAGARNPRTREQIFPGLEPGSEPGWAFFFPSPTSGPPISASYFKYLLENPQWDFRTLNFDTDVALADKRHKVILNAMDLNLKAFVARGKLILYHGWRDPAIAPLNTVNYYNSVVATLGGREATERSVRLFMIPGLYHCGAGVWLFDAIGALDKWVEQGQAPDRIIASHFSNPGFNVYVDISPWSSAFGKVDRTRPLCPYPQIAKYTGHGSTDDAANFVCTEVSDRVKRPH